MQTVEYILTGSEMNLAATAGVQRALDAIRRGRNGRYGADDGAGFDHDVNGCVGELTLAKHLNRYWNGNFGDLSAADVDKNYQARASDYDGPNAGLILHKPDKDDHVFVKAFIRLPRVRLMGWLYGHEGKLDMFWTDRMRPGRPAYLIPHADLRPMSSLNV